MPMPKAYAPEHGCMYQLLVWDNYSRSYDHLDYAVSTEEKNYLLQEYKAAFGKEYRFKAILLPKKYWKNKITV